MKRSSAEARSASDRSRACPYPGSRSLGADAALCEASVSSVPFLVAEDGWTRAPSGSPTLLLDAPMESNEEAVNQHCLGQPSGPQDHRALDVVLAQSRLSTLKNGPLAAFW